MPKPEEVDPEPKKPKTREPERDPFDPRPEQDPFDPNPEQNPLEPDPEQSPFDPDPEQSPVELPPEETPFDPHPEQDPFNPETNPATPEQKETATSPDTLEPGSVQQEGDGNSGSWVAKGALEEQQAALSDMFDKMAYLMKASEVSPFTEGQLEAFKHQSYDPDTELPAEKWRQLLRIAERYSDHGTQAPIAKQLLKVLSRIPLEPQLEEWTQVASRSPENLDLMRIKELESDIRKMLLETMNMTLGFRDQLVEDLEDKSVGNLVDILAEAIGRVGGDLVAEIREIEKSGTVERLSETDRIGTRLLDQRVKKRNKIESDIAAANEKLSRDQRILQRSQAERDAVSADLSNARDLDPSTDTRDISAMIKKYDLPVDADIVEALSDKLEDAEGKLKRSQQRLASRQSELAEQQQARQDFNAEIQRLVDAYQQAGSSITKRWSKARDTAQKAIAKQTNLDKNAIKQLDQLFKRFDEGLSESVVNTQRELKRTTIRPDRLLDSMNETAMILKSYRIKLSDIEQLIGRRAAPLVAPMHEALDIIGLGLRSELRFLEDLGAV